MNKFLKILFLFISVLLSAAANSFERTRLVNDELMPPILNRIWVQGKPYELDTPISQISTILLPFNKNFVVVEFISINYYEQNKLQYAYRLGGVDSTWIFSGNQRRASYANLGPGTYLFQMKVSDDGINWVYNTKKVSIIVTPPFWAQWWFQLVVILFVFSLLVLIYYLRVNAAIKKVLYTTEIRKKESESLRIMMAEDFHDEMGNKLASIIVLVSTLQLLIKDKNKEIQKSLARIESSSKKLFDGTKSFIWSMNPKSDRLDEVAAYISNFGSELFDNTPILFSVERDISETYIDIRLPIGYSRQLFFIFKEAMTNTLVHSECSEARLYFSIDKKKSTLVIVYEDYGKGVTESQLNSIRGIANMKSRAKRIHYDLEFYHNPEGGFSVRIEGELPKT